MILKTMFESIAKTNTTQTDGDEEEDWNGV